MGSDGGGGGNPALLLQGGIPMGGLPIAGSGANVDPYNYGQFQNFLPDQPSAADVAKGARAPSATGLTSEMFTYKKPDGNVAPGGGDSDLRAQLAALLTKVNSGNSLNSTGQQWPAPNDPYYYAPHLDAGAGGA